MVDRLQGHRRGPPPRLPRSSSRAGSSFTPRAASPVQQEEVGRHLALAGETARGRDPLPPLGRGRARRSITNEKAIRLFDRALACLGGQDLAQRIHIWHDLGSVYELIGDFEAALGAFERMLRLSWVAASKTKAAVAFNKMGRVWRRKGDLKLALEYLERGLELFRGAERCAVASRARSTTSARRCRCSAATTRRTRRSPRRSRAAARAATSARSRPRCRGSATSSRTAVSTSPRYTCHKEALELRKAIGDRWGADRVAEQPRGAVVRARRCRERAEPAGSRRCPRPRQIGALPLAALILTNLGEVALVDGKLEEARSRLENALEIIEDVEDRGLESECCRHLATLEKLQGQPRGGPRARRARTRGRQEVGPAREGGPGLLTLGDVLSTSLYDATDHADGADTALDASVAYAKAIDVLREIGNEAALGKALYAFGRYKAETGALADGKDMLRDAIAVFAKLGLAGLPATPRSCSRRCTSAPSHDRPATWRDADLAPRRFARHGCRTRR